jgi:DNA-binding GntR family transcriptional regulator
VLEDHWTASQRYRSGYQLIPGRAKLTIAEHQSIIDAIAAGDPERARSAARAHIQKAGDELAVIVSKQREG